MFRSIQGRITIWLVIVVLVCMGALGTFLIRSFHDMQMRNLHDQLSSEARILAATARPHLAGPDQTELQSLSQELGQEISARITIIAVDGTVIADSQENPAVMENHLGRPEVRGALAAGYGESTRYSTTLKQRMMYVAVSINDGGVVLGIARVALPLVYLENFANLLTGTVVASISVAGILAILAAWLVTRTTTQSLRELTGAAQHLTSGDLNPRIPIRSSDEAGQLAQAFRNMTGNLQEMVDTINTDRAKLASILDNMTDGIIMTDSDGNVTLANKAAERFFKFSAAAMISRPVIEVVRDHEIEELRRRCLQSREPQAAHFEASLSQRFLRTFAIPGAPGQPGGVLLLFQDLTEMRTLQTMRREMVGNISHEFRTPLASLKAMVETLQSGALDDRAAAMDFLGRINGEIDRLTQMVAELTELSRIETGGVALKRAPVDLNRLAGQVIADLSPQAERKGISLNQEPAADLPPVPADRDRLCQVLTNLLHNAIKFTPDGGRITVSTELAGDTAAVQVTDSGMGISPEDLPHVFERFYKADKARSGSGTGLGLAIARHIVEAHGGDIQAISEEGKGATFRFRLPLSAPDSPES
ncbi:MAG: ATP-binding protein [Chloroflexota bacterium]